MADIQKHNDASIFACAARMTETANYVISTVIKDCVIAIYIYCNHSLAECKDIVYATQCNVYT